MKPLLSLTLNYSKLNIYYDPAPLDPRKQFDNYSKKEVEAWEDGQVFGFETEEQCIHCGNWSVSDGCWGFYGWDHLKETIFDHIDDKWKVFSKDIQNFIP